MKEEIIKFKTIENKDVSKECMFASYRFNDIMIERINTIRKDLYTFGYVGVNKDGVGYGNISVRSSDYFIITGSGVSKKYILDQTDFVLIEECNFKENLVKYNGLKKPSSETMVHGVLYDLFKDVNAVVHVHNYELWEKMSVNKKIPKMSKKVKYGSVDMVKCLKELSVKDNFIDSGVFISMGHVAGIYGFGATLEKALINILTHNILNEI